MIKEEIHIEPVTKDDLDVLRELSISTFYESFILANSEKNMQDYINIHLTREKLTMELEDSNSKFYFVLLDGNPVGYLKINTGKSQTELQSENSVEIERIYVDKNYQGKKLGQVLFEKATDVARDLKAQYLWLGVWEKNEGAMKFYERNGLEKFSEHLFKLGDDIQTDIMMRLKL